MWGHTLAEMLKAREWMTAIPKFKPDVFIFSGGGNDLQEALKKGGLILPYNPARPIEQCLSPEGENLLLVIAQGYRTLLNELAVQFPTLPSICFAYDYPKPNTDDGEYIGQYFRRLGYPEDKFDAVAAVMIDRLSATISGVVTSFPKSFFLDCRKVTEGYDFYDDMHPDTDGFKALATKFEQAFGSPPPAHPALFAAPTIKFKATDPAAAKVRKPGRAAFKKPAKGKTKPKKGPAKKSR